MLDFILWTIGIGLFLVYGLPVIFLGFSLVAGLFICLFGWVESIFKGGKNG
jgi:hypothetical protein